MEKLFSFDPLTICILFFRILHSLHFNLSTLITGNSICKFKVVNDSVHAISRGIVNWAQSTLLTVLIVRSGSQSHLLDENSAPQAGSRLLSNLESICMLTHTSCTYLTYVLGSSSKTYLCLSCGVFFYREEVEVDFMVSCPLFVYFSADPA